MIEIKKGGAVRVESSVDGNTGSIEIEAPGLTDDAASTVATLNPVMVNTEAATLGEFGQLEIDELDPLAS